MQLFIEILMGITLPILSLVALGYATQLRLGFDAETLTRIHINILVPAALIYFPYSSNVPLDAAWPIVWFSLIHFVFLFGFGWGAAWLMGMNRQVCGMIALAALFANSGNYGIPLIQLAFPEDFLFYQTVVFGLHSIIIVPLVVFAFQTEENARGSLWSGLFGTPILPAVMVGIALKGLAIELPVVVELPLKLLSDAFTPLALLLLGIQLAAIHGRVERKPLILATVARLIVAPGSAWLLALAFGLPPGLTAFFVVTSTVPAGILLAIFAAKFNANTGLASMLVFISTALSALTVTLWVYAVRYAGLI